MTTNTETSAAPVFGKSAYKYAKQAAELRSRHFNAQYAMIFCSALEHLARDTEMPGEARVLASAWVDSWGKFSDYMIDAFPRINSNDPEPRARTLHKEIAAEIGMPESRYSVMFGRLRDLGYLRNDTHLVYPLMTGAPCPFWRTSAGRSQILTSLKQGPVPPTKQTRSQLLTPLNFLSSNVCILMKLLSLYKTLTG